MAHIIFYEKPGCLGNQKQKAILESAGHTLDVRDLLTAPWTRETLLPFFQGMSVDAWFNPAAPKIKKGEIDPKTFAPDDALGALLAEPLLIRRPLMQIGAEHFCGFDEARLNTLLNLSQSVPDSVASCAKGESDPVCGDPR